jgi:hypothetical protein
MVYSRHSRLGIHDGLAFLSEYQPQTRTVPVATAPPGVDKIKVCLELPAKTVWVALQLGVAHIHLRVSKAFDNDIADYIPVKMLSEILKDDEKDTYNYSKHHSVCLLTVATSVLLPMASNNLLMIEVSTINHVLTSVNASFT